MDVKPFNPEEWTLPEPGEEKDPADYEEPTEEELAALEAETAEDVRLGRTVEARAFFEQLYRKMPIAS